MKNTSNEIGRKITPNVDLNSDLSNITENNDEALTVKNRSFCKTTIKNNSLVLNLNRSSLVVGRIKWDSNKRSHRSKLLEAGSGYFMAVINKILKRRKRATMQSIRDIIYQRVKVLALLSFSMDLFKDKRKEYFKYFIDSSKYAKRRESKESCLFSFNADSGKTPKFQLSESQLNKIDVELCIEEGLYMVNDIIVKKQKIKLINLLKLLKRPLSNNRYRTMRVASLKNNNWLKFKTVLSFSTKRINSNANIELLFNLTSVLFRNKLARYFYAFQHELKIIKNTSNHKIDSQAYKESHIIAESKAKLFTVLCNLVTKYSIGLAFDVISNSPTRIVHRKEKVVHGKVKDIRRSITPLKGINFTRKLTGQNNKSQQKLSHATNTNPEAIYRGPFKNHISRDHVKILTTLDDQPFISNSCLMMSTSDHSRIDVERKLKSSVKSKNPPIKSQRQAFKSMTHQPAYQIDSNMDKNTQRTYTNGRYIAGSKIIDSNFQESIVFKVSNITRNSETRLNEKSTHIMTLPLIKRITCPKSWNLSKGKTQNLSKKNEDAMKTINQTILTEHN